MDSIDAFSPHRAATQGHGRDVYRGEPPFALFRDEGEPDLGASQMSVLVCAAANDRGELARLVRAGGHRVLDEVTVAAAAAHMERVIALDVVLLRCTGDEAGLPDLLFKLDRLAEAGQIALLVGVDLAGLDRVHALIRTRQAILLCQPSVEEQVAAIAALAERHRRKDHLYDVGAEAETDRLERLNDQLLRLNQMVETLVQGRAPDPDDLRPWSDGEMLLQSPARRYQAAVRQNGRLERPISAQQVRAVLRVRRLRDQLVAADLFADPAWDILLDLLAARLDDTRVSVSSLCIAAAVPPTTALRWIRHLTDRGLLERQADPRDGRRIFIALSDSGMEAVLRWFRESRPLLQCAAEDKE